ncbi:MAG: tripartite tricarboxylate transporter permease [Proteobacteria bacterium]|nr:tripartite tricarboxylate transporter permease [Burkholderiales bacterium]
MGFGVAVSLENLIYAFIGCLLGTLVGVLPGIGPVAAIALLLPTTFALPPVGALIMLAGIYYGAQYGGSTTAILVNLPGESSSVVTCLDGHAMAKNGRAGHALAIAAIGSFFAGTVCTLIIAVAAPPLAEMALKFGAPEYFSLMVFGLIASAVLARGSLIKALGMILVGLLLGIVGTDVNSGMSRFTFGMPGLSDGIGFVVIAMAFFGLGEIIKNLETPDDQRQVFTDKVSGLMPRWEDIRMSAGAIVRGTFLGAFFGTLPGTGPVVAAFSTYAMEKKIAKDSSQFGRGDIRGVAGPESANNAAAQTAFIPTLTLGIPGSGTMALMLGAMMIQGIAPGPQVMTSRPDLFWGLIASMWIGNLMLVILNLPLIGIWVQLLKVPYRLLFPAILMFMCIGTYSLNNSIQDPLLMGFFGVVGYAFMKFGCEPAPMLLGFILGPLMEENLRRALLISRGDPTVFFTRPISLTFLVLAAGALLVIVLPAVRKKRDEAFQGDE